MKKYYNKFTIITMSLIILIGILSFVSIHLSHSVVVDSYTEKNSNDDKLWNLLEEAEDLKSVSVESVVDQVLEEVKPPEVVVATEKDEEQDPMKVVKQEAKVNKGVAKETKVKEEIKKYETNETSFGIDVSTYQGDIDWKKVKKSGITFAMIRCGFRKLDSGQIVMDNKFEKNMKGAIANQINVGVYFFSVAKNKTEALEEAKWVYNVIKDYDITYPVAYDTEIFNNYRLKGVSYSTLTDNAIVFCDYIKSKGYTPIIYSYANAFTKYFETARFSKYRIWLAQYNDEVTYKGKYHMWQNTSSGHVDGIKGRVDMDVAYFSITNDVTKASSVNGITNTGNLDIVPFMDLSMNTKLNKDVNLRISPYTNLPNKAGILEKDTSIVVTGIGDSFIRILYNNDTFYIQDTNCFEWNLESMDKTLVKVDAKVNKSVKMLSTKDYKFKKLELDEDIRIIGIGIDFTEIEYQDNNYYIFDVDFYDVTRDYQGRSSS